MKTGDRIYYTGDMANLESFGHIVKMHPAHVYGPESCDIQLEDPARLLRRVWLMSFDPGPGRRFWLADEWNAEREAHIQSAREQADRPERMCVMSDICVILRRARLHSAGPDGDEVTARVSGETVDFDSAPTVEIDMGSTEHPPQAWWEIPLPPCPDCGGEIIWAEAGHAPGTRECTRCKSLFQCETQTQSKHNETPHKYNYCCDNGHRWEYTDAEDLAADHKCPTCGEYWV